MDILHISISGTERDFSHHRFLLAQLINKILLLSLSQPMRKIFHFPQLFQDLFVKNTWRNYLHFSTFCSNEISVRILLNAIENRMSLSHSKQKNLDKIQNIIKTKNFHFIFLYSVHKHGTRLNSLDEKIY